jgi:hypothetical protein
VVTEPAARSHRLRTVMNRWNKSVDCAATLGRKMEEAEAFARAGFSAPVGLQVDVRIRQGNP